ncbi:MAG: carbohydrate ABC transporter permease [Eubacteriales bacterium]|nr:carbohydrate ABC transporter permease [Eubacteriales bacterium]
MKQSRVGFVTYFILILAAIISVFPFVWTFLASTHTNTQIFQLEYTLKAGSNFSENLKNLLNVAPYWRNMANSIFIAGIYTVFVLLFDSMAGYAFAKFDFKGKNLIFFLCIASMFIPQQVTMVPLFIQLSAFGLMDTPWAVILPGLANVFGVFLMRQSFEAFPNDLIESARIDGAGDFRIFFTIVAPTMKPAFTSLGILSFVNQWGNFMWPLIALNSKDQYTMPLVLSLMVQPGMIIDYGAVMAGAVISLLPVLIFFLIFQKNFIDGILAGAVKG